MLAGLALAGACASNAPDPKADTALRDLAERVPTRDDDRGEPRPCGLVSNAYIEEASATPVHRSFQSESSFALPGMNEVDAERCDFEFVRGERLYVVTVRMASTKAESLLAALERVDSAALRPVEAGVFPTTAIAAYWQSVGTTMWVRSGDRFVGVEVVAEAPTESDFALAAGVASQVLGLG